MHEIECLQCGKEVEVTRKVRKFCGISCANKWKAPSMKKGIWKQCKCGKWFYRMQSQAKTAKHCSNRCKALAKRRRLKSCWKCNTRYLRTKEYFYKNRSSCDGLQGICKTCDKIRRRKSVYAPSLPSDLIDAREGLLITYVPTPV